MRPISQDPEAPGAYRPAPINARLRPDATTAGIMPYVQYERHRDGNTPTVAIPRRKADSGGQLGADVPGMRNPCQT